MPNTDPPRWRQLYLLLAVFSLLTFLSACAPNQNEENTTDEDHHPPSTGDWWQPVPGTTWQWQLTGEIDTSYEVEMYDIDLFEVPQETIQQLQEDGRVVICYFSAGTWEEWREDASDFPEEVVGKTMEEWEDERWLDVRAIDSLAPIMEARLDLAVEKGCDGVEPDNVDGYSNRTGFPLSAEDQLAFNRWLAEEAHARGLSVGLKNDLDQVKELVSVFDWALNEQCFEYDECEMLMPFIEQGKAVFGVEYELETDEFCEQANLMRLSWMRKDWDLDSWTEACWEE
jgi:hypothetical protein